MNEARTLVLPVEGRSADFNSGSLFFIGTATIILRYAGLTILTDPNFLHQGDHVHLGYGLRSTRRTNPAVAPRTAIPIHFNDYTVFKSPLEDFMKAIAAAGLEQKVRYLNHGDTYNFEVSASQ